MRCSSLRLLIILTLGLMLCLPGSASANNIGELNPGDWSGSWRENGVYNGGNQTFDMMEIFVITGNPWQDPALPGQNPALSNFSAAGWHFDRLPNPNYGVASGPTYTPNVSGDFYFTTNGVDPFTDPFVWDVVWWSGGKIVGVQRSTYQSGGWDFVDLTTHPPSENRSAVPLPASVLLLGSGLVGVGLLGFRRRH